MMITILIVITLLFVVYLHFFSPARIQKLEDEAFIKELESKMKNKKDVPDQE
jgi:hypothetical protein